MRAFLLFALGVAILVVATPVCLFEAVYRYELLKVNALPRPPATRVPQRIGVALWKIEGGSDDPEPLWAGNIFRGDAGMLERLAIPYATVRPRRDLLERIAIAVWLSRHASAAELKQLLAAQTYFGRGAYGLDEAAQAYFGKDVGALRSDELAVLLGLPQSPRKIDPRRRSIVLRELAREGFITSLEQHAADARPLELLPRRQSASAE